MNTLRKIIREILLEGFIGGNTVVDEELDVNIDKEKQWFVITSDKPNEIYEQLAGGGQLQKIANAAGLKFFFNKFAKKWFISYSEESIRNSKKFTGASTPEELYQKIMQIINKANTEIDSSYKEKTPEEIKERFKNLFAVIEKAGTDFSKISTTDVGSSDEEEKTITPQIIAVAKKDIQDYYKFIDELADSMDEKALVDEIMKIEEMRRKFHGFSMSNTIYIMIQSKGEASNCMNKKKWEMMFNRRIKDPSRGMLVQFPAFADNKTNPLAIRDKITYYREKGNIQKVKELEKQRDANESVLIGFKWGLTYDISNTEVIPGKEDLVYDYKWHEDDLPDALADKLFRYAIEFATKNNIKVDVKEALSGARGSSAGGQIKLMSNIKGVGALSTIIHEIAHELMHWKGSKFFSEDGAERSRDGYSIGELQAETTSFIILRSYGFALTGSHQLYISLYKGNKDKIKKYTDLLSKVANFIENGINEVAIEHGEGEK